MFKKWISGALAACLLVSSLAMFTACSGDSTSSDDSASSSNSTSSGDKGKDDGGKKPAGEKVFLNYWLFDLGGPYTKLHQKIVDSFNKSQDEVVVNLSVQPISATKSITEFDEKFLPAFAAKKAPDVVPFSDLVTAAINGYATDLTENVGKDIKDGVYYDTLMNYCKYNEKYWALPFEITYIGFLVYNKDLFKKAGLDPNKPPTTMEELEAYADKMFEKNSKGVYTQIGFDPNEWLYAVGYNWARPFGGSAFDENGNYTPNSPEMVKALEWAANFTKKHGGVDKLAEIRTDQSLIYGNFTHGVEAMSYAYNNQISELKAQKVSFEYGITRFPTVAGANDAAYCSGFRYGIVKTAKDKEAAWKFLKYLCGPEGTGIGVRDGFNDSVMMGYSPCPAVNEEYKDKMDPALASIVDLLPTLEYKENVYSDANYSTYLSSAFNDAMSGKGEPKALLDEVKRKTEAFKKPQ